MFFLDLSKNRYTTKKYNSELKISEDKIQQLKEILRLSPSSIDSQPWKFTFVADEKIKLQFAKVSQTNEHKVKDASHLVIFSAIDNLSNFEKQINDNLPDRAIDYYNKNVKPLSVNEIKAWFAHQVYLSLGFFLAACASLEIDSTTMEGIDTNEYAKILNNEDYKPLFAVAIGYRNPEDSNQPSVTPKSRLNISEIIETL